MASAFNMAHPARCLRLQSLQPQHARLFSTAPTKSEEMVLHQPKAVRTRKLRVLEVMPYQCFQEARKVLLEDRKEKVLRIEEQRRRIERAQAKPVEQYDGAYAKKGKLVAMHKQLEKLKVYADINDPRIKKRFEDGEGDLNRPVYRHLAEQKWRSYKYKMLVQRIEQFHLVPDLLRKLDPVVDMTIVYHGKQVPPGDTVPSDVSERPPKLTVQSFEQGPRLVTIAVVDPDVPNVETDGFQYRCHYLAANIPITPTEPHITLAGLPPAHVVLPWLPPHAQKGSPYHRVAIFAFEQPDGKPVDVEAARQKEEQQRLGWKVRSFVDRYGVQPVGATLFRTEWDATTRAVMVRAGLGDEARVELQRKKPEALPWHRKVKDGDRYR